MPDRLPIRVLTELGPELHRPSRRELADLVEHLGNGTGCWITANRIPDLPNVFLQTALESDGGFLVEWRDGGPLMLAASVGDRTRVIELFTGWASGASGWADGLEWSDSGFEAPESSPVSPEARAEAEASATRAIREGYWSFDEIRRRIEEESGADDSIDAAQALEILNPLWSTAVDEQRSWPTETDCDRLEAAFAGLDADGILAKANFTCCQNCGAHEIWEDADGATRGYVFFHRQDLEHAADGGPLMLSYGAASNTDDDIRTVGGEVATALERAGLAVDWNGEPGTRIAVVDMEWRKRLT